MDSEERPERLRRAAFVLLLVLTMLPQFLFPLESYFYHAIYGLPALSQGEIDLSGYGFHRAVPLDGAWQFFPGRWIVSQAQTPSPQTPAPRLVPVPSPWDRYCQDSDLDCGKASYRILLKNCPAAAPRDPAGSGVNLVAYIPNIDAQYRVYIDGQLVSSRGVGAKRQLLDEARLPAGSDAELVVELHSGRIGGMYITPLLARAENERMRGSLRQLIAAGCIGVLVFSVGCVIGYLFLRDKSLHSVALAVMDLLVCLNLLMHDEFFEVLQQIFPRIPYDTVGAVLQGALFFLPVIFLVCIKQLIHLAIGNRVIVLTALYELVLFPGLLWCVLGGQPQLQYYAYLAGYLPFVYIVARLYRGVLQGNPYRLMASASLLFIMSGVLAAALDESGMLVMNPSLFSPVCVVIAIILQVALYIRRGYDVRMEAVEAENLRLRLRESETSLMLSQIKPHFLYNTLVAIHMMCLEEPQAAAQTVMKFASFLRTNMRFISSTAPIPFAQELEHIKNFADIEQLRFQKRLSVRYDIGPTGFLVPPLTIQPLVENAIRHGACKNLSGGTVLLRTLETALAFVIEVQDDGPGFDPAILDSPDEERYGIANIRLRLRNQMSAAVNFESSPERGTLARVTLPKEAQP